MVKHEPCCRCGTLNRHIITHKTQSGTTYEVKCDNCKNKNTTNFSFETREAAWKFWDNQQRKMRVIVADSKPDEKLIEFAKKEIIHLSEWLEDDEKLINRRYPYDDNSIIAIAHREMHHYQEMCRAILLDWISSKI